MSPLSSSLRVEGLYKLLPSSPNLIDLSDCVKSKYTCTRLIKLFITMANQRNTMTIVLVMCICLLSSTLAYPVRESYSGRGAKAEGKPRLRAHMSDGAQPRFAEYPLLYSSGFQRQ